MRINSGQTPKRINYLCRFFGEISRFLVIIENKRKKTVLVGIKATSLI